jgi:predicted TPR repeat methyltransferase
MREDSTRRRDVGRPPSRPALPLRRGERCEGRSRGRGGTVHAMPGDRAGLAPAWFALGSARERLGDVDGAIAAYRRAAASDLEDVLGASLTLARLGEVPTPAAAAPAYVARLFNQYAPRFDAHLVGSLGYRGPALLYEAARDVCERTNRPMQFARALDLGCGTGLAGAACWPSRRKLTRARDMSSVQTLASRTRGVMSSGLPRKSGCM